jgi:hypothetical protein
VIAHAPSSVARQPRRRPAAERESGASGARPLADLRPQAAALQALQRSIAESPAMVAQRRLTAAAASRPLRAPALPASSPVQLMPDGDRLRLRILIQSGLQHYGLPAGPDDVGRVMNVVAPEQRLMRINPFNEPEPRLVPSVSQEDVTLEIAWLRAQTLIVQMAMRAAPPQQQPAAADGDGEGMDVSEPAVQQPGPQPAAAVAAAAPSHQDLMAARIARFGDGALAQQAETRQREAEEAQVGAALRGANIQYVGDRYYAHLTRGGDGQAGVTLQEAEHILRSGRPQRHGVDRFTGAPAFVVRYSHGQIAFSTADGGGNLRVFHIGPGS